MKKMLNTSDEIIPQIGMGVTIAYYSDSCPATIIQITNNGKRLVVQVDSSTRTDTNGVSDIQSYTYSTDPNGEILIVTKRKDGTYRLTKSKSLVHIGVRRKFHDYSF